MGTFTKSRHDAPPGFFEAEAAGLRWLARAGGARVADVVDVAPQRIELERIEPARPTADAARSFGRDLARTHLAGAPRFGSPPEGWDGPLFIGSREMPSTTADAWGAFYAAARVLPFLDPALAAGHLTIDEAALVRDACAAIADAAFDDDAPPARIHGDLWAGNLLFDARGAVLIDPAAHGGHAETDLAMLAVFGAPYLESILDGYQDVSPLRDGWRARIPVHQLHPLAVHAAGHGRAYGVELAEAARATLALAGR
ncbi:fructosamine kinase family protein [Demequina activiva]|uniref:Fructosamine kinase n=1 Tax=Demequina activiva TaxID=1582364 RepID=A0A919UK97_9MICO|nr:fructosamine kinase family protein [Demequina activiva]GIG55076.1 fructosamine kinase [Demequina activiva]